MVVLTMGVNARVQATSIAIEEKPVMNRMVKATRGVAEVGIVPPGSGAV